MQVTAAGTMEQGSQEVYEVGQRLLNPHDDMYIFQSLWVLSSTLETFWQLDTDQH